MDMASIIGSICLGSFTAKRGVPSYKKCTSMTHEPTRTEHYVEEEVHHDDCYVTTTAKPTCEHYVEEEVHHEYCEVPLCKKCSTRTTTCKPSCVVHYDEEEVHHDDCYVTTTAKPSCEHTYEEEQCPHGYFWNGYFCAEECNYTTRYLPHHVAGHDLLGYENNYLSHHYGCPSLVSHHVRPHYLPHVPCKTCHGCQSCKTKKSSELYPCPYRQHGPCECNH
uniref:Uncharacterized protein n=1 Tax=Anopheles funestus TaxID=62324 RepID=A0A182RDH0_ANOFN